MKGDPMFRFPDKPKGNLSRAGLAAFQTAANGLYLAQAKLDGWRTVIEIGEDEITYTSRHKKAIPVSRELRDHLEPLLRMAFKPGTILDAEWCARRPGAREEKLWLFDLLRHGDDDLYTEGALDRFEMLCQLGAPQLYECIVPHATGDYVAFFDSLAPGGDRHMPEAEGIVLKARTSKFIGSPRSCADNPGWTRCKWRAGEDGMTKVA